jgi:hypothetical protein
MSWNFNNISLSSIASTLSDVVTLDNLNEDDLNKIKNDNNSNDNNSMPIKSTESHLIPVSSKNRESEEITRQLLDEISSLKDIVQVYDSETKSSNDKLKQINKELQLERTNLSELNNEYKVIYKDNELKNKSIEQFELTIAKLQNEKNIIKKTNNYLEKSLNETKHNLIFEQTEVNNVNEKYNIDIEASNILSIELQTQVDTLKKTVKNRTQQIAKLQNKIDNFEKDKTDNNIIPSSPSSSTSNLPLSPGEKVTSYEDILNILNEDKQLLEDSIDKYKLTLNENETKIIKLEKSNESKINELKKLKESNNEELEKHNKEFLILEEKHKILIDSNNNLNETIKSNENIILELTKKNDIIIEERNNFKSEIHIISTNLKKKEESYDDYVNNSTKENKLKEMNIIELKKELNNIKEKINEENSSISINKSKLDELISINQLKDNKIKELDDSNIDLNNKYNEIELKFDNATKEIVDKDKKNEDNDIKIKTLAEKMKELMKKYAEIKAKNENLELNGNKNSDELTTVIAKKDSEIMSLKLKLEYSKNSNDENVEISNEQLIKIGELQRELSRSKEIANQNVLTLDSVQKELNDVIENNKLKSLSEINEIKSKSSELNQKQLNELKENNIKIIEDMQADNLLKFNNEVIKYKKLEDQIKILNNDLQLQSETSSMLEEYKKRAQLALKKTNNTSSNLQTDLTRIQNELDIFMIKNNELEVNINKEKELNILIKGDLNKEKNIHELLKIKHNEIIKSNDINIELIKNSTDKIDALEEKIVFANLKSQEIKTPEKAVNCNNNNLNNNMKMDENSNEEGNWIEPSDFNTNTPNFSSNPTKNDISSISKSINNSIEGNLSGLKSNSNSNNNLTRSIDTPISKSLFRRNDSQNSIGSNSSNKNTTDNNDVSVEISEGNEYQLNNPSSDQLFYVTELYSQLEELRRNLSHRNIEYDKSRQELVLERENKIKLEHRIEELLAYLERTNKLHDGPDASVNMEYLKNCIYKYMTSVELSEKKRLYPVIATILKLTNKEKDDIENLLDTQTTHDNKIAGGISNITSTFGSFFGST